MVFHSKDFSQYTLGTLHPMVFLIMLLVLLQADILNKNNVFLKTTI